MNFNRQAQLGVGILVVVSCVCLFFVLTFGASHVDFFKEKQINLVAKFDDVSGLYVKAPVRIAGVNIGMAKKIYLEPDTYRAIVDLEVEESTPIPMDSVIKIYTEGVLGSKYLAVVPGYDDMMMQNGDVFIQAESSVILEGLISQVMNAFSGN